MSAPTEAGQTDDQERVPGGCWPSDSACPLDRPYRLRSRLVEQRLECGVLERLLSGGIVEHLLERLLYGQRFPDLFDGGLGIDAAKRARFDLVRDDPVLDGGMGDAG